MFGLLSEPSAERTYERKPPRAASNGRKTTDRTRSDGPRLYLPVVLLRCHCQAARLSEIVDISWIRSLTVWYKTVTTDQLIGRIGSPTGPFHMQPHAVPPHMDLPLRRFSFRLGAVALKFSISMRNWRISMISPRLIESGYDAERLMSTHRADYRFWPGAELSGRARSLHPRRTGHACRSEAHGSSTLSTSRRVPRAARRQSLLGEQQAPARSRLDPPPSRLSRLSGDRPQRGESGPTSLPYKSVIDDVRVDVHQAHVVEQLDF